MDRGKSEIFRVPMESEICKNVIKSQGAFAPQLHPIRPPNDKEKKKEVKGRHSGLY